MSLHEGGYGGYNSALFIYVIFFYYISQYISLCLIVAKYQVWWLRLSWWSDPPISFSI